MNHWYEKSRREATGDCCSLLCQISHMADRFLIKALVTPNSRGRWWIGSRGTFIFELWNAWKFWSWLSSFILYELCLRISVPRYRSQIRYQHLHLYGLIKFCWIEGCDCANLSLESYSRWHFVACLSHISLSGIWKSYSISFFQMYLETVRALSLPEAILRSCILLRCH